MFWNSDKLIGLTAMFISICTLIVFLYQTNLIKKQQYASVFPYLELGHWGTSTENYRFILENKGIGPALITEIKIRYKDTLLDKDLPGFVRSRIDERDSLSFFYSSIYKGRLISANERISLIENNDGKANSSRYLHKIIDDPDLEFIITYESIYEEKWQIKKGNTGTLKLD